MTKLPDFDIPLIHIDGNGVSFGPPGIQYDASSDKWKFPKIEVPSPQPTPIPQQEYDPNTGRVIYKPNGQSGDASKPDQADSQVANTNTATDALNDSDQYAADMFGADNPVMSAPMSYTLREAANDNRPFKRKNKSIGQLFYPGFEK